MKKFGAVVAFIIVIFAAFFVFSNSDVVDRFNPFVTKEYVYVYVQVNQPAKPEDHRFKYNLSGYNAEGKKKNVTFTSSTDLEQGIYLKVLAKGAYTQEWERVKKEDLPKGIEW